MRPDAVFFVTGAAHGIGAAFARLATGRGAQVVLADVDEDSARALAGTLGARAHAVALDVRDEGAWQRALDEAWTRFGRVDVVVNNAGLLHGGELLEQSAEQLRHMLDVNLLGVAYGLRAAVPRLARQGGGHVVDVASLAAYVPLKGQAFYSATKHAVVGLSESLYRELEGTGVGVHCLCPNLVRTKIFHSERNRDDGAAMKPSQTATIAPLREAISALGIPPDQVAADIVDAMRANRFWIFTHETTKQSLAVRYADIEAGRNPSNAYARIEGLEGLARAEQESRS